MSGLLGDLLASFLLIGVGFALGYWTAWMGGKEEENQKKKIVGTVYVRVVPLFEGGPRKRRGCGLFGKGTRK